MQDKADLVVDSCESIADKLFNAINHAKDPNKTALIVKKSAVAMQTCVIALFLLRHCSLLTRSAV